jgi:hypothetical protein
MSSIADINGIWIADDNTPAGNCGCLASDPERKPNAPSQSFTLVPDKNFKLIGWVTGHEAERRIYLRADIHKTFEVLSRYDLGQSGAVPLSAADKDKIQPVIWVWPKAANWKIPGEYQVHLSLGHAGGDDLSGKPAWDPPVPFTFSVINK